MTEPIILGLTPTIVAGLIAAIVNILRAYSLLDVSQEQVDALNAAVLPIMTVLAILGSAWARSKSTPTDSPVLPPGTLVNERSAELPTSRVEPLP